MDPTSISGGVAEYMLWLTWTLLSLTPVELKNPVHDMIFATQDIMESLMSGSNLEFATGLLNAIESKVAPSLAFFKGLSTCTKEERLWGVYAIVLEKAGCRPKIYVGSGTEVVYGIRRRLHDYDDITATSPISQYVQIALRDGFIITHKGLLCWSSLPGPLTRYQLRALMLILETTFSIVFWGMKSRTKDYGMPRHLCPWQIDALDYDGCCTHMAIIEGVLGENLGLTDEQILAKEAELLQRASDGKKARYYGSKESDFAAWKATRRRYEAKRDHAEKLESMYRSKAKAKAEWRFACETCGLPFEERSLLDMHNLTKRHIDKVRGIAPKPPKCLEYGVWAKANITAKKHHCAVCDHTTSTKQKLDIHFTSQRHQKRAAAAAEAAVAEAVVAAAETTASSESSSSLVATEKVPLSPSPVMTEKAPLRRGIERYFVALNRQR